MILRTRFFSLIVFVLIIHLMAFASDLRAESSEDRSCVRTLRGLVDRVMISGFVSLGLTLAPTSYHNVNAIAQGQEHLGAGIYLDMDQVIEVLSPSEREILYSTARDLESVKRIASLIASKLHGDYHDSGCEYWPSQRSASSYLLGQSETRGVCRHKALIARAIFSQLGIQARLQNVSFPDSGHLYVVLPDYGLAVEPTWASMKESGFVVRIEDYDEILTQNQGVKTEKYNSASRVIYDTFFGGLAR